MKYYYYFKHEDVFPMKKTVSCWGCGSDFLSTFSLEDLTEVLWEENKIAVCPACYEDIDQQYFDTTEKHLYE
jgi:hypothetical protein